MKAEEMVLGMGKTTVNELFLAQKIDELIEEIKLLKQPKRFKVVKPFRLKESS